MCCPCCRNDKYYSDWGTIHLHLIKNRFMANYVLWTMLGERGVVMEENEEEEDDSNIPHWAAGQVSGIHPGYLPRKVEDGLLLEFPCNPTRTHSV
jgi:hypothetical protein